MIQSYLETTFNVPLTGQQISEIYFYMSYWQVQNKHCFDANDKDYIQEYVDDFENLESTLKQPIKTYERNFS
jgi:ABC-type polysaccharide/polyol phosphate transport system ATPase subunit